MEEDEPPDDLSLVVVGRYPRLSMARERGLVLAAMDLPHWILREKPDFVVSVEARFREAASIELEKYEAEARQQRPEVTETPEGKLPVVSLWVAAWIMGGFWFAQNYFSETWMARGSADSGRMIHGGEWWRMLTALTLHGDLSHFAANLMVGLLFVSFLIRQWGSGPAWLATVVSGAAGNALNAWVYRDERHLSIGASTAVFGALGLLVGGEFARRLSSPHTRQRWQLILPIGAGLGLLAFLGAGDERKQIDIMAHLWGFVAGLVIGAAGTTAGKRASPLIQRAAAAAALLLLALAWWRAMAR